MVMRHNCDNEPSSSLPNNCAGSTPSLALAGDGVTTQQPATAMRIVSPRDGTSTDLRRKLRIFKEPSSNGSISEIIWSPKSPPRPQASVDGGGADSATIFFATAPLSKLSNVSCASLPLPSRKDSTDATGASRRSQRYLPASAKSLHSLLYEAPILESGDPTTARDNIASSECVIDLREVQMDSMARVDDGNRVDFEENGTCENLRNQDQAQLKEKPDTNAYSCITYKLHLEPELESLEFLPELECDSEVKSHPQTAISFWRGVLSKSFDSLTRVVAKTKAKRCVSFGDAPTGDGDLHEFAATISRFSDGEKFDLFAEECKAFFRFDKLFEMDQTRISLLDMHYNVEKCRADISLRNANNSQLLTDDTVENQRVQQMQMPNYDSSNDTSDAENSMRAESAENSRILNAISGSRIPTENSASLRAVSELSPQASPKPGASFFAESFNVCDSHAVTNFNEEIRNEAFAAEITQRTERSKEEVEKKNSRENQRNSRENVMHLSSNLEYLNASNMPKNDVHLALALSPEMEDKKSGKLQNECIRISSTRVAADSPDMDQNEARGSFPVSASTPAPIFKCIRQLRVEIVQLRAFHYADAFAFGANALSYFEDAQLSATIKLDSDEVFQSACVPATSNCTFGVETSCELPPDFHALHVILTSTCERSRISAPVGRVTVTRRELFDAAERFADAWLPIARVIGAPCTQILGDMCIDACFDVREHVLSIRIVDYTVWPLKRAKTTGKHDNNNNNKMAQQQHHYHHQQQQNARGTHFRQNSNASLLGSATGSLSGTLRRGGGSGGEKMPVTAAALAEATFSDALEYFHQQSANPSAPNCLYLQMCVSSGNARYSPMRKLRVIERRGVEVTRIDCAQLVVDAKKTSTTSSASARTVSSSASATSAGTNAGETKANRLVGADPKSPPLKSLSPPPRLSPSYKGIAEHTPKPITLPKTLTTTPNASSSTLDTFENDILLAPAAAAGATNIGRLKARSRLLSSGGGGAANAPHARVLENPLKTTISAHSHSTKTPKQQLKKGRKEESKSVRNTSAAKVESRRAPSTAKAAGVWQSTSSIPDSYAFSVMTPRKTSAQSLPPAGAASRKDAGVVVAPKLRLNIKVYGDASYDESSYCGYVRIPLDPATMLPAGFPLGPNWFNIKSRTTWQEPTNPASSPSSQHTTAIITPKLARQARGAPLRPSKDVSASDATDAGYAHLLRTARQRQHAPMANELVAAGAAASPNASQHQRKFIASLETPPLHYRHATTPSTSRGAFVESQIAARCNAASDAKSMPSGISLSAAEAAPSYYGTSASVKNSISTSKSVIRGENSGAFTVTSTTKLTTVATNTEKIGEMRLKLRYNIEEILPLVHYQPLYLNLINSLSIKPTSASLTSILQYLPISIEKIAGPLMKTFVYAGEILPLLKMICFEYVSSCQTDVNTLFRSHSLASKLICELLDFVGQDYLIVTLKPLIDLIFAERKCCEIDPSKMRAGDSIDENLRNLIVYAELAFGRIIDSRRRCPRVLREVFAELRAIIAQRFPGRDDVARLAISSFLMLRFFNPAILYPKHFALRNEVPEADVARTLVLVSKIIQRLANCVVSAHPFSIKEEWLTPVMTRFLDNAHRRAMMRFLDAVSCAPNMTSRREALALARSDALDQGDATITAPSDGDAGACANGASTSDSDDDGFVDAYRDCCCDGGAEIAQLVERNRLTGNEKLPLSCHEFRKKTPALLKHGHMIERRNGSDKKKSFKNFIHQKRRYVTLTETQLSWQKVSSGSVADLQHSLSLPSPNRHNRLASDAPTLDASAAAAAGFERGVAARKSSRDSDNGGADNKNVALHRHSLHNYHNIQREQLQQQQQTVQNGLHKGHFVLSEITSVSPLCESKHSFRVATPHSEVHFQASSAGEMNEWLILIQKQQRRHIMLMNRSSSEAPRLGADLNAKRSSASSQHLPAISDVEIEREMQLIHAHLLEHVDTLCQWRSALERDHAAIVQQLAAASALSAASAATAGRKSSATTLQAAANTTVPAASVPLPLEKIFKNSTTIGEREACLAKLYETLVATIAAIQQIEGAHQTARNLAFQMKMLRQQNSNINKFASNNENNKEKNTVETNNNSDNNTVNESRYH